MSDNSEGVHEMRDWSRAQVVEHLSMAREASTRSRRAWHEGVAAAFCYAVDDRTELRRGRNLLTLILVDYTGAAQVQGRRGFQWGVAMLRGASSYGEKLGAATLDLWQEARVPVDDDPTAP